MFATPTHQHHHGLVKHEPSSPHSPPNSSKRGSDFAISALVSSFGSSMERSAPDYSGLPSPYPSQYGDTRSEASPADQTSAAPFVTQQEVRSSTYTTSATATPTSEFGVYPSSARSGSFPEHHLQRSYHPASSASGGAGGGGMAQTPTNPSIAAASPTYGQNPYSPYGAAPPDVSHGYHHPGSAGLYTQPRPDWTAGYAGQHGTPITPGHPVYPQTPTSATSQRPSQVYSFVPIPGAQQHKRPRRRYEEIERMYKCGWNGCEKAYGTLNHLNAHVTMQSHGQKRTPEEFKEIRKEWKARKKEEEQQRKAADEERQRQAAAAAQNGTDTQGAADGGQSASSYAGPRQLPPIGYGSTQYPAPPSAGLQQPMSDYGSSGVFHPSYQPTSPYGQGGAPIYSQHAGGQTNH